MIMKQYLIALALLLSLNAGQATAARKSAHRRHQALTEQAARQGKTAKADSADKAKTYQKGIEAYSDTSSAAGVKDSMVQPVTIYHNRTKVESESEPIIQAILNGTLGAGGFLLAIVAILAALLFSLAPLIAFIFLIKYFINRHNKRIELAEKAMEKGVPIPEAAKSLKSESPEYYWKRGVRNVSIGIGIAIMFAFVNEAGFLVGCGLMFACYGVGQLVIGKTTK